MVSLLHAVLLVLAALGASTLVVLGLARLFEDAFGRRGW
jgi:hypothetical protein